MLLHQKKLYASAADRVAYERLIKEGVIVEYQEKKVHGQQTCSLCSDGFRPHMKEKVLNTCHSNGGDNAFFHPFTGHGEAMRFAYNSPLSEGFSDRNNADFWGSGKTKEISEFHGWAEETGVLVKQHRLVHHWPCKAAISRNISLAESIDLVIRGKLRIKHQMPGLKVAIDLFCDWGPNEHSMACIKKEAYVFLISNDWLFAKQHDGWMAHEEQIKKLPILRTIALDQEQFPSWEITKIDNPQLLGAS